MNEGEPRPEQERRETLRPRIWVGSLADYNAGRLHGEWLEAAVSDEELYEAAQRVLATSPEPGAEEWGIFDYDEFGAFRVHEHDRLEDVAAVARGIREHGPAFAAWAALHDGDPKMLRHFEDAFLGEYETAEDWAREVLSDSELEAKLDREVPPPLRGYVSIDYAALAHDEQINGGVHVESAPGGRVWVFAVM